MTHAQPMTERYAGQSYGRAARFTVKPGTATGYAEHTVPVRAPDLGSVRESAADQLGGPAILHG